MSIKNPLRLVFVTIFVLWLSAGIIISMLNVINSEQHSHVDHLKIENTPANRGNIYTYDNELLAVTSSQYDLRIDEDRVKSTGPVYDAFLKSHRHFLIESAKNLAAQLGY